MIATDSTTLDPMVKDKTSIFLILSVIAVLVSMTALFLPWIHSEASSTVSIPYYHGSTTASGQAFSGVQSVEGICSLILLIVSGLFLFKRKSFALILPFISLATAILFVNRMSSVQSIVAGPGFSGAAGIETDAGFYIFSAATIMYIVFSGLFLLTRGKQVKVSSRILGIGILQLLSLIFVLNNFFLIIDRPGLFETQYTIYMLGGFGIIYLIVCLFMKIWKTVLLLITITLSYGCILFVISASTLPDSTKQLIVSLGLSFSALAWISALIMTWSEAIQKRNTAQLSLR